MREKLIEKYLRLEVEKLGGLCKKWNCEGWNGVPDRIVLFPYGKIYFIELKKTGARPRALQEYRHQQLEKLGFTVLVLDSTLSIDEFIESVTFFTCTKPKDKELSN